MAQRPRFHHARATQGTTSSPIATCLATSMHNAHLSITIYCADSQLNSNLEVFRPPAACEGVICFGRMLCENNVDVTSYIDIHETGKCYHHTQRDLQCHFTKREYYRSNMPTMFTGSCRHRLDVPASHGNHAIRPSPKSPSTTSHMPELHPDSTTTNPPLRRCCHRALSLRLSGSVSWCNKSSPLASLIPYMQHLVHSQLHADDGVLVLSALPRPTPLLSSFKHALANAVGLGSACMGYC